MLQKNDHGTDRRTRILDAAERCFVRSGFHRTTVQDVAAEAGMSAGNLYRYFPSKDAIVDGLTERDQREVAGMFGALDEAPDFMAGFAELGRQCFHDEPREKAVLCLEIWAEAARNPASATRSAAFAAEIVGRMTELLDRAKAAGSIAPLMSTGAVAAVICTLADGLFVRRAILPDFDAEREIPAILDVICAMVSGAVVPQHQAAREVAR
jgi:TetR/AcrR family transcriptional regulator, repressor for uid operon